jgi:hypothetical protein
MLSLTLAACGLTNTSTKSNPSSPAPAPKPPAHGITLCFGGTLQGGCTLTADDTWVIVKVYRFKNGVSVIHKETKSRLTPEQWKDFWRKVAALDIPHWRRSYTDSRVDPAMCTIFWSVDLYQSGTHHHSEGLGVYPQKSNPRRSCFEGGHHRVSALEDLMSDLAHSSSTAPR